MPESELPVSCQFDPKYNMFRVIRAKGKTLSSGGFGVAITSAGETTEKKKTTDCSGSSSELSNFRSETFDYLFIEEVLFLHERGLLITSSGDSSEVPLDSSQLYQMLPRLGSSLPVYLVYSHLRSQDFRVLRHHPDRLEILKRQLSSTPTSLIRRQTLKRQIRSTIQLASSPNITENGIRICFDVYMPNTNFAKLSPGLPDFYVAATYYHQPQVSFADCKDVMAKCQGIPLKLATVSDSGTVVMFGLTDFGTPMINTSMR